MEGVPWRALPGASIAEAAPLGHPIEVVRPDGARTIVPREVCVWAR